MEWTVRLEAKFGWSGVQSFEVGRLSRRVQGLTADEIVLMLGDAQALLAELQPPPAGLPPMERYMLARMLRI